MLVVNSLIWLLIHWSAIQCLDFDEWKQKNPQGYKDATEYKSESAAKATYEANQKIIDQHNQNANSTYTMGNNANSGLTEDERNKLRKGYRYKNETTSSNGTVNSAVIKDGMKKKAQKQSTVPKATTTSAKKASQGTSSTMKSATKSTPITTKSTPKTSKSTIKTTKSTVKTTIKMPSTTTAKTTTKKKKSKREVSEFESDDEHHHSRSKRYAIPKSLDLSAGLTAKNQLNCASSWAFAAITLVIILVESLNLVLALFQSIMISTPD